MVPIARRILLRVLSAARSGAETVRRILRPFDCFQRHSIWGNWAPMHIATGMGHD